MTKILRTNKQTYEVIENEDGSLTINYLNGKPIPNAGALIYTLGGCKAVLARCKTTDKSIQQIRDDEDEAELNRILASRDQVQKEFLAIHNDTFVEPTIKNIRIYLAFLNIACDYPKLPFGIAYSVDRYIDAPSGRIMSTITFDTPIDYYGKQVRKFVVGASIRELNGYQHL